jgi:hypothetical protein
MYREIKKLVIFVIVVTAINCNLLMSRQRQLTGVITLDVQPKVTKGFPVVVKVNIEGPQKVFHTSIFYGDLNIEVHITSKSNGKEFIITSSLSRTGVGMSPGGGLMDITNQAFPPLTVPKGQKYTMLFDLWSLSPGSTSKTALSDVPAGKYSMFVKFYRENVQSTPIDIELIEPTEQEKQFIQKIREFGEGRLKYRGSVSWSASLDYSNVIPGDVIDSLTQVAKDQISFHKLLSDVDITGEKTKNKSIKDVNDAKLPKFFEPEKQLLLLELKGNPTKERENLLKKYPQMQEMVNELDAGGNPFLSSKEFAVKYLKRQNKPNEPNKPAELPKLNRQNINRNDSNY